MSNFSRFQGYWNSLFWGDQYIYLATNKSCTVYTTVLDAVRHRLRSEVYAIYTHITIVKTRKPRCKLSSRENCRRDAVTCSSKPKDKETNQKGFKPKCCFCFGFSVLLRFGDRLSNKFCFMRTTYSIIIVNFMFADKRKLRLTINMNHLKRTKGLKFI